jgi:hypothetical protein
MIQEFVREDSSEELVLEAEIGSELLLSRGLPHFDFDFLLHSSSKKINYLNFSSDFQFFL